jgi:hypothetical protein
MIRAPNSALTLLLLWGVLAMGSSVRAADRRSDEELVAQLVDRGFENVGVSDRADTTTIWYENRVYRHELEALGLVAFLMASSVESETVVSLVPENYGVPLIAVSAVSADWLEFLRGRQPPGWFRERVTIRPGEGEAESIRHGRPSLYHSSLWRTDLRLRPLFDFELGVSDDPFRSAFLIAPEAVMSPLPGTLLTLQVMIEIDDDLSDLPKRNVRPGRNTLSWGGWLPGRWLGAVSGGYFPRDRYGFAGQIGSLLKDGSFEITSGGDFTGLLEFLEDITLYSSLDAWSAFLAVTHRTHRLDLETTLTGARFMEGDLGVRVDLSRRFGEAALGFFGINTESDKVVGVGLRLPLPVRRWSAPSRVRFTTVPAFPFEYRDSLADVGLQVSQFDDLDRLRKRLYPTYILNNLEDFRDAIP